MRIMVRNLSQAVALAEQDLDSRPDIHGYDTLAWALYRNGRFDEAAKALGPHVLNDEARLLDASCYPANRLRDVNLCDSPFR